MVCLTVGLAACAGAPPASQPPATPQSSATRPAEPPAAAAAENPFPGMTPCVGRNGETLYCREDAVAGTRIPRLVCATAEVLRNQQRDSRRMIEEVRTTSGLGGCDPSAGC
jgi:hypothetical protein